MKNEENVQPEVGSEIELEALRQLVAEKLVEFKEASGADAQLLRATASTMQTQV